ncbi:MAG TPA: GAF domain-containing protein [Sphingomicrobium sp.]|nr:GAF domain-containing protein [Sphingomicrobium sp.]
MPDLNDRVIFAGDDDRLRAVLEEVCASTGMGFAAIARVTEQQWIACQVVDKIEFGLDPGQELKIRETICDEIRDSGEAVVIDDASDDIKWSRHPVPVIYGFKSYCSFPVYLDDGSFFGTLCAIDPEPRRLNDEAIIQLFTALAKKVGQVLSERQRTLAGETVS